MDYKIFSNYLIATRKLLFFDLGLCIAFVLICSTTNAANNIYFRPYNQCLKNISNGCEELNKLCLGGDAKACFNLGSANRRKNPLDPKAGLVEIRKSCEFGYKDACELIKLAESNKSNLINLKNEKGTGSLSELDTKCNSGDSAACVNLGALYMYDRNNLDFEKGYAAYKKGCALKNVSACQLVKNIELIKSLGELNAKERAKLKSK